MVEVQISLVIFGVICIMMIPLIRGSLVWFMNENGNGHERAENYSVLSVIVGGMSLFAAFVAATGDHNSGNEPVQHVSSTISTNHNR